MGFGSVVPTEIRGHALDDDGSGFGGFIGAVGPERAELSRSERLRPAPLSARGFPGPARDDGGPGDHLDSTGSGRAEPGALESAGQWRITPLPPYVPGAAVLPDSLWPELPARPAAAPVPAHPTLAMLRRERLQAEQAAT